MSHIVSVKTEVRDPVAVSAACRRLGLPEPVHGTAKLFEGEATGLLVRLPGWLYPVACDTATGELKFDNYNGAWGPQEHLDRFMQIYAVEKAGLEARKKGYSVSEQPLEDGSIRLQIVEADEPLPAPGPPARPGPLPPTLSNSIQIGEGLMPRIIEVTVSPRGEATVQTKGYTGGDCLAASKFLERALGVSAADRKTAEFYQGQSTDQALTQSQ